MLAVSIYLSINAINDYRAGVFASVVGESQRIRAVSKVCLRNSNDLALHLVTMVPIAVTLGLSGRNP